MTIATIKGTQLLIKVGDGASPTELFAQPCLINAQRGISFEVSSNKHVVPDCDNPDDPAWQQVVKDVIGATINGAGKLDTTDVLTYHNWATGPDTKNVQVWLGSTGYWQGAFHCTKFEVSGDRGSLAECAIGLESNGIVTFTPA